ncbi:MAG: ABC transporter ATP-binding protein [Clostridium sp.]
MLINIKNLTKSFEDNLAVDNLSLSIDKGEILGFLGPNGAGKTTTINMITSILKPTKGEIEIFGKSFFKHAPEIKSRMGIVPQNIALYENLTVEENIIFFAKLYGLRKNLLKEGLDFALDFTSLQDHKSTKCKHLSSGMQRRLNIACAISHKPEIIIMDEPTVGIDTQSRNHILHMVKKLNEEGCTIIYTSHYMEEVQQLCNKIAIMDNGKLIAKGTKDELISLISDNSTLEIEVYDINENLLENLMQIKGVTQYTVNKGKVLISSSKDVSNLNHIINFFTSNNIEIKNLGYKSLDLEDVFLTLTGKKLRD